MVEWASEKTFRLTAYLWDDDGWIGRETNLANPDFAADAKNCGARGIRVEDLTELDAGFDEPFACDGLALVERLTDANPV